MMGEKPKGPVLISLDAPPEPARRAPLVKPMERLEQPDLTPATAPPVPDPDQAIQPTGEAMQRVAGLAGRRGSALARVFWGSALVLLGFLGSVAAWDMLSGLLARSPILGFTAAALFAVFGLACLLLALREALALARLRRIDGLRDAAARALALDDAAAAQGVLKRLAALYAHRPELAQARAGLAARFGDVMDADTALALGETGLLAPLDAQAQAEVEAAARQVATVTAIVPLALADLVAALVANLRMIRRIAEIYGGRSGTLGSWRLTRLVMAHLVATGAVAVGDDLLGALAGGGVLSKLSRRFGEGLVNGALTARVGVAAIETCRPLPFVAGQKPSVTGLVGRSLKGLFPGI